MGNAEIVGLLRAFISGADQSLALANKLEVMLDDEFPENEYLQETVEVLACYRPGGGSAVVGAEALSQRLSQTLQYLSGA